MPVELHFLGELIYIITTDLLCRLLRTISDFDCGPVQYITAIAKGEFVMFLTICLRECILLHLRWIMLCALVLFVVN